ncbi:MAG: helix-turn-helix domain-containing protein [Ktedonobacterales bacterium]
MATDAARTEGPIAAHENERNALDAVERSVESTDAPTILGTGGEQIQLPESVAHLLRQMVFHLAHDRGVVIVPVNKELTTQEAADILNVSRPYLVKLLEQGGIPFVKTGAHRRISFDDLMAYKARRDATRRDALTRLTQMSEDLGLYVE